MDCGRCLVVAGLVFGSLGARAAVESAPRPDVVFILADDLGSHDPGFTGGTEIKTPHLDRLAAAGAVLKQFYVQPLCSPTRAALMTGRYPIRYGLQVGVIRPTAEYGLPLEERMLPQVLRESGYGTSICGKWHLGSFDRAYWPTSRGFDHHCGHLFGAIDYFTHERDNRKDWWRDGEPCKDEGYSTHLIAREAVRRIEEQPAGKPLFLYVPFNAVHGPWQVPEEYKAPYGGLAEPRRTYAGMVAALDEAVGQIVAAVDKKGRRKDTLFIFSSDNGGPSPGKVTDNGPLRAGKGTVYEGGVRVCAFATWEGQLPPGAVDQPIHMVDWYPTLLRLAGASPEQPLPPDGFDIWPVLAGGQLSPRKEIVCNITPKGGAIRVGDWKLVVGGSPDNRGEGAAPKKGGRRKGGRESLELFDLKEDPGERNNLAEQQPAKAAELRARYESLAREAAPPKNQE